MRNLGNVRRIVVKVGTSVLTTQYGTLNEAAIEQIAEVLSQVQRSGINVALVTCGAIPAGVAKLRLSEYPSDMRVKQAAAAVGQVSLMNTYDKFFTCYSVPVAQVLIEKHTFGRDDTLANLTNTMNALFGLGVIPIINENDTTITDEINRGDNDMLAANIAGTIGADLAFFLTKVDGLYGRNSVFGPRIISEVSAITDEIKESARDPNATTHPAGGLTTKLSAAVVAATKSNTKTIILNGYKPQLLIDALRGANVGTFFDLCSSPVNAQTPPVFA